MADQERTSETKEISKNLEPATADDGSAPKTESEQNARNEEDGEQRASGIRDTAGASDASSAEQRREGSDATRNESGEVEKEVTEKRVEKEENVEVQETQETITEEVGHRESNVESSEAVEIENTNDGQPQEPQVQQPPTERSPDVEVLKPAKSETAEPDPAEQYEPLPEYLPDSADQEEPKESYEQVDEEPVRVENSAEAPAEIEPAVPERSPPPAEALNSPALVGQISHVIERSPRPFEKSPLRSGSLGRAEREETPSEKRVKLSTGEIRIPNLKAQLNSIIKDIEDNVEEPPQEEMQEEIGEDGQVYHTWKPKGKYDFEQTPVVREEVVPISVDDVPEPPPQQPQPPEERDEAEGLEYDQMQGDGSGTVRIQPVMPNGAPASPIEIPEGIPLLARILPKEDDANRERIPLERLFTPATDSGEITPRKKKAFASSDFYAPDHPTIDDQLQLAQKISGSLADQTNKASRGQAMYEKRKQRSEKWIHTAQSSETFSINDSSPKSKPAMKLVMNPKGVQDHTTVEQHYEQLMQESSTSSSGALPSHIGPSVHIPSSPEIAKDIINDMQSPTGKGAALFAKRKKRMDKFIVDETNVQRSSAYQQQSVVQNSSFEQSFTNQVSSFSSSSTSSSGGGVLPQTAAPAPALTAPPGSKKRMQQERDMEQQKIMNEFLNKRESQFQMVKSPWEAALEGNAAAAFKQNTITSKMSSSSFSSTSTVGVGGPATWLEGPKPVPVAAPLPKPAGGASLPNPPAPFARPAVNAASTTPPAFKAAAPAPAVPTFVPAAATPVFVPGASSGNPAPPSGNQGVGFAPTAGVANPSVGLGAANPSVGLGAANPSVGLGAANPALGAQFTPRATIGNVASPNLADKRKSANFNLAASGWGTYNEYYRPTSFASS